MKPALSLGLLSVLAMTTLCIITAHSGAQAVEPEETLSIHVISHTDDPCEGNEGDCEPPALPMED